MPKVDDPAFVKLRSRGYSYDEILDILDVTKETGAAESSDLVSASVQYVDNKFAQVFRPESYGAKGDYDPVADTGTDDTAAIQAAINAAQAVHGKVVLSAKYYRVTTPPTITAPVAIEGMGVQTLNGNWATEGYWSMGFPTRDPFLTGSVIVQTGAGQHGLIDTPGYGSSILNGFGILFGKAIRYTNTGHGIYSPAGGTTTFGGPDNGVTNGIRDNLAVFGHDGNHYGYYCVNNIYSTWGQLQSFGGGGLYWENNTGTGGQPQHYYGNLSSQHLFLVTFVGGSADVMKIQNVNSGAANLFHFDRVQGVTWNVGTIAGVTPTVPTLSQALLRCSPFVDYLTIVSPDFETSVSSPIILPTFGNIFMGIGGAFPTNPRLFIAADAAVRYRALYSDLSARLSQSEVAGSKWNLLSLPSGKSLAVATDGTDVTSLPGPLAYGFDMGGAVVTSGESSMPRYSASASTTMSSGALRLTYFTAVKSETINNVRVCTTGTAAGATPTLVRIGLYSVATNGDLTLVASTANDTTLLAATNTLYTKPLSAPYAKVAGQRYAFGMLVVTGAAAPTVRGQTMPGSAAEDGSTGGRLTGFVGAQNDLPSNVIAGAVSDSVGYLYGVVTP